jgi:hypothetical protein
MSLRSFILCLAVSLVLSPLAAQTSTTGGIAGVLTDSSGAVVAGAIVKIRNRATGALQSSKSSNSGSYRFDLLPPGLYQLDIMQPGFNELKTDVAVDSSKVLSADLKLAVAGTQQTIEVTTDTSLVQADDANVATTISQAQVAEVPNSGNNLLFETKITPGFNTGFGVVGNTSYQLDGENFNDPYNNANNSGASNLTLGLNDVQEATIIANGYSGQFGGLVGATASFVTKSGGNRVHGNANYFWTGRSLVANTYLHKSTPPITPRSFENANQWSAIISGPVVIPHLFNGHDKLFFLADAEGLRAILPASPTTVELPSANLQAYTLARLTAKGLTNSLPFYKNIFNLYNTASAAHGISVTNPTAAQQGNPNFGGTALLTGCGTLSATDAAALGTGPGACTNFYQSTATTYANEALEIFRVDYIISQRDKIFVRYEHDNGVQPTTIDPVNAAFNAISIQPQHDGQLTETHVFGAKAVNSFLMAGLWYGALFGPPNLPATLAVFPAQLNFSDSSLTTLGGSDASFPTGRNISTAQFQDDFALNEGAHTIKVGAKAYYIKENDHYFTAGTVPNETATTLGAFINGGVDAGSSGTTNFTEAYPSKPSYPVGYDQWAVYAEDDWKATHALSLSFAFRVEHQGNIKCLSNCLTQLASDFVTLNHSASIPYNQAYSFNNRVALPGLQSIEPQPRIGFAYNPPIMHESMVIRGGYGLFYDGLAGSILEGLARNPPTKDTFSNINGDSLANTETTNLYSDAAALSTAFANGVTSGGTVASIKASLPTNLQPFFTPPSVYTPQANLRMYYVQKWNLEIQKQLGKTTVISVNYLGNRGEHKPFTNAGLNAYSPASAPAYSTAAKPYIVGLPNNTGPLTASGSAPQYNTQPVDPRFNIVYRYQSGGSNNYNGLITSITQKLPHGGIITAGYTYGKILDTGANGFGTNTATAGTYDIGSPVDPYNPNRNYGPATTDERHNLVVNYVYRLPFRNPFYGGFEISGAAYAYSGLPYTAVDTSLSTKINTYTNGAYGGTLLPTYNGGGETTCGYGKQQCILGLQKVSGGKYVAGQFCSFLPAGGASCPSAVPGANGTAAALPNGNFVATVDSDTPRNALRGPMYVSTDLAVTKSFPLHWEGGRFSASAQAFNVLNHLNFSRPSGSLSSGSFGQVTTTINPAGIFSGVGGDDSPRILQLKANVTF